MPQASSISKESSVFATWERVRGHLREEYGEATFQSWLRHLELRGVDGSEVVLVVPTRFIREWIRNNYIPRITALWKKEEPSVMMVTLLVRTASMAVAEEKQTIAGGIDVTGQNVDVLEAENNAGPGSPLDRRFTFDNFIVGQSNELPFAAAKSVAESSQILPGNNPFYLYGGVGLGKTHLMHAIAWRMREINPDRKVVYLSAERFMYQFVKALRDKEIMAFKEGFRSIDVLIIDDVQFICGKESTQEEFHHTCNALLDRNKQLIISGDRSPADLDGMKERIRSRLGWGLVVDINQASYDLRLGILRSKVKQMQGIAVPDEVLEFLAGKILSNTRELEGALNKVVAHSTLVGRNISLEGTQEILADLLRANERVLTVVDIQKKVADYYNIKMADMSSARRTRCVARPRQVAMYLAKNHTLRSLSEIGRKFGGKDHTTVMHAVKRVEALCASDAEFKEDIKILEKSIKQ